MWSEQLVSEELPDLRTDENTLLDFCSTDSWEFLPCLVSTPTAMLYPSEDPDLLQDRLIHSV
jgi:hypothetical protein